MVIKAHKVSSGKGEGEAVVYAGPFSFLGDMNPATGKICAPGHKLEGTSIANKVFVFTTGKGSGGGDVVVWTAKKNDNAPAAIICVESEPVLSSAVIATKIPTVDRLEKNVFDLIKTGDYVRVNAAEGIVEIVGKEGRSMRS